MYIKEEYESLGQRIAAYYLIVLKPLFDPVRGAYLSCYKDIYDFFYSMYGIFYEKPNLLGIPMKPDNCFDYCDTPEKKKAFLKDFMQIFKIFESVLNFFYQAGASGQMQGRTLVIDPKIYLHFVRQSKRIKEQIVSGLSLIGLDIKITDRGVEISNHKTPGMIEGLHILSNMCSNSPHKNGYFHFYRCDFDVLNKDFTKMNTRIFDQITRGDGSYGYIVALWDYMDKTGYQFQFDLKDSFRITQSCSHSKIKRTPLLKISFDIRYKSMLNISLQFVSTHKIVPYLEETPLFVKKDFYEISTPCRGDTCLQHKALKGNAMPSVVHLDFNEKTICWRLKVNYTVLNEHNFQLIKNYLLLHQRLLED